MNPPRIAVVGSMVMDLVVWLDHLPRRHETQVPSRFETHRGGKGFNQAVTARRMGAEVIMAGKVGADAWGDEFVAALAREGIDAAHVSRSQETGTSFALPMIVPGGDNSIVLIQRANARLRPEEVEHAGAAIEAADVLVLQLEVPVAASLAAARIARASGRCTILNPAPADPSLDWSALMEHVDWLVPNEVEAEALTGLPVSGLESAAEAAELLLARGLGEGVVVTLGDRGAVVTTARGSEPLAPFPAEALDPTGAGDAFIGAFAVALAEGRPPSEAGRWGCAAGSLAVRVAGAEPSLPARAAVQALVGEAKP